MVDDEPLPLLASPGLLVDGTVVTVVEPALLGKALPLLASPGLFVPGEALTAGLIGGVVAVVCWQPVTTTRTPVMLSMMREVGAFMQYASMRFVG